jgi:hypothetical protein
MTTNIDRELSRSNELRDEELTSVSGGLVVPSIIGILVGPGPLPSLKEPAPEKHWFNGG